MSEQLTLFPLTPAPPQALTPEPPTIPPAIVEDISDALEFEGIIGELYQLGDVLFDFEKSEEFTITGFRGTETFFTESGYTEREIHFECSYADGLFRVIRYEDFDENFHQRKYAPLGDEFANYAETYFAGFHQQTDEGEQPTATPAEITREIMKAQIAAGYISKTDDGVIFRQGADEVFYLATTGRWVSENSDPETEIVQLT